MEHVIYGESSLTHTNLLVLKKTLSVTNLPKSTFSDPSDCFTLPNKGLEKNVQERLL